MNVNDLMIGDWVIPHIWDSIGEPSKIVGISYHSYEGKDYVDGVDCEVWDELSPNDIEPIPLTSEILEKNGFEYDNYNHNWIYDEFTIDYGHLIEEDDNDYLFIWVADISVKLTYVHELQHALRLCGIKKEIIL